MPTFEYEATVKSTNNGKNGEEVTEWGTVVAPSQTGAEDKLRQLGLVPVRLTPLSGIKSFFKSFTADVK
jgi:hypothetical protein